MIHPVKDDIGIPDQHSRKSSNDFLYLYGYRTSREEVFFGKDVLKICRKFAGEHPWRSAISIKLLRMVVFL